MIILIVIILALQYVVVILFALFDTFMEGELMYTKKRDLNLRSEERRCRERV